MSETKFGSWVVAQSPVDVEYSLAVIDQIRQVVADGFQRLQRGGIEVGGVLYGTRQGRILRITAMREIACEHARGPTFHLSDNDRAALTAQLQRDKEDMRLEGLLVVGWFLSHTRSDVTLQQSDLETYQKFFPEPWQITMVVHPGRAGTMRAGFFVREPDGSVKGDRSYQEFNFPDRLAAVLDRPPRERRGPGEAAGEWPSAPRYPTSRDGGDGREPVEQTFDHLFGPHPGQRSGPPAGQAPGQLFDRAFGPPAERAHSQFDTPSFGFPAHAPPAYDPYPNTGRKIPWGMVGVIAALLAASVAGLRYIVPQLNPEPLSLAVIERDGQLQIRWNHASPSVSNADGANLEILDGPDKREIPMNRSELAKGSFTYARHTGEVQVRLTVLGAGGRSMEESSRFLGVAPSTVDASELDTLKVERDALQDEVQRLRGQTAAQAERIQQLQRTLTVLQTRLGITGQ